MKMLSVMAVIGIVGGMCLPGVVAGAPPVVREDIEWFDAWLPNSNATGLPRVLLIGDSITKAYYGGVEARLKGKAFVGRFATSKSVGDPALLAEVALVLSEAKFDVVHFNNGMHGFGYSEDDYRRCFPDLVKTIRHGAPAAKLICATTTPARQGKDMGEFKPLTTRIRERNKIATAVAAQEHVPVDDLFGLVEQHPEFYVGGDGIHLGPKGITAQAEQVAQQILKVLGGQ
jgi:hypothetical protein